MGFDTASYEEIKRAEVADVYFYRMMEILRARGLENTPVHAEVAYKTSDPDEWFVVAGLDEVARLLEGIEVEAHSVPAGPICRPKDRKSVVLGKSVDLGGRRIINKNIYIDANRTSV